ncbi:ATP-dependent Clp protease ATP-binding subunit [Pseudolactococcus yaeyamensis]
MDGLDFFTGFDAEFQIVDDTSTPFLDKYTENLTEKIAKNPDNYKVFEREKEIEKIEVSLIRKSKNAPLLIGEAGTGKTAIIEGFVRQTILGNVTDNLRGMTIRNLELSNLMNENEDGNFISKFKRIIEELVETANENIIFIDEIHTLVGVGGDGRFLDASNVIKPVLARGEIKLIGATTLDEYHESIEQDKALERRFQTIVVSEPTPKQAKSILGGARSNFERFYGVKVTDIAVEEAVNLSVRYIPDRFLPDKAFDLIDEAMSYAVIKHQTSITDIEVAEVLQVRTGIPVTTILKDDSERLKDIKPILKQRVKGQDFAIASISDAITISKAGLQDENKPIMTAMLLGTTGVGKTETGKALAEVLFDDESALIRFDMSEYSQPGSSLKLIGNSKIKGNLTEAVKRKPYSIILLDELEKSDREVHDLLLQILDDGRLTDGQGRLVNFKNTIVIMTTNIGAEKIKIQQDLKGDIDQLNERDFLQFIESMDIELQNVFRPEFINRIEYKAIFKMLNRDVIKEIAVKNLDNINKRIAKKNLNLEWDEQLIDFLADVGTDMNNGARPLARLINKRILAPVSELSLKITDDDQHTIIIKTIGQKPDPDKGEVVDKRTLEFTII